MSGYVFWCRRCAKDHAGECPPARPAIEKLDWKMYLPTNELPEDKTLAPWMPGDIIHSAYSSSSAVVFKVLTAEVGGASRSCQIEILAARKTWLDEVGKQMRVDRASVIGLYSARIFP